MESEALQVLAAYGALALSVIVNADVIRVMELRRRKRFFLKPLNGLLIVRELPVDNLQRNFPIDLNLTRLKDSSHAAFSDEIQNLVAVAPGTTDQLLVMTNQISLGGLDLQVGRMRMILAGCRPNANEHTRFLPSSSGKGASLFFLQ